MTVPGCRVLSQRKVHAAIMVEWARSDSTMLISDAVHDEAGSTGMLTGACLKYDMRPVTLQSSGDVAARYVLQSG